MSIAIKAMGVWFLILVLAVANGAAREKLLAPALGERWAQVVSGLLLSGIILAVALGFCRMVGIAAARQAWAVGGLWLAATLAFEFLFGHFVGGDSWGKLLQAYDVRTGNLWSLVVVVTALAPWLAGKVRGLF